MYPLFETIAIVDGTPRNLAYHAKRHHRSLLHFRVDSWLDFDKLLKNNPMPSELRQNPLVRCRVDYDKTSQSVAYYAYTPRTITTFLPVVCDEIDYSLKYSDRTALQALFGKRCDCDEIMIVKHGKITDCTIGNLIFKKNNEWFTPATPLLDGTMREYLIDAGKITPLDITLKDLDRFEEIRLINALNGLPI